MFDVILERPFILIVQVLGDALQPLRGCLFGLVGSTPSGDAAGGCCIALWRRLRW